LFAGYGQTKKKSRKEKPVKVKYFRAKLFEMES
jgi:hypothetical protein